MKDFKQITDYLYDRKYFIARNKTSDVFCAGCLQATEPGDKSTCCTKAILTKEQALERIEEIMQDIRSRKNG